MYGGQKSMLDIFSVSVYLRFCLFLKASLTLNPEFTNLAKTS